MLALERTKRKERKASEPGGRVGNAAVGTISKEIYGIYSHLFLPPKRNAVLIKEADRVPQLRHVG